MTQRIFRGKEKSTEEWIYGYLIEDYICSGLEINTCKAIIPFTVGQYTGIRDSKDKKIFESDIVEDCEGIKYLVKWNDEEAGFFLYEINGDTYGLYSMDEVGKLTVIGNTHDMLAACYCGG